MVRIPFVKRKYYEEAVYKLECLLCAVTGGRLSKHNYPLRIMERCANEHIQECCEEAIKEFAARLKEQAYLSKEWSHGEHPMVVECDDIDDLLDEMVGDSK